VRDPQVDRVTSATFLGHALEHEPVEHPNEDTMTTLPIELLEQFEHGNVLIFVGEGIHCGVLPSSAELARELAERCDYPPNEPVTLPRVAGYYEMTRDRNGLIQFLRDRLENPAFKSQRTHQLIARLGPRVIVTTCYDRLIEHALREADLPYLPVVGNAEVAYADESKVLLVWLWGALERPESIVVTEDDRRRFLEGRANLSDVLRGELARRTWLFVGFDAEDEWFRGFYDSVSRGLDRQSRCAYIFGTPSAYARAWWEKHNARVIGAEVEPFLITLTEQLAARRRPPIPAVSPVEIAPAPLPERPYKLLDYYEAKDAALFFGRQSEIQKLSSLIHGHRLTLLYGASGVGKTSLLLAGAAPRLEQAEPPYETLYVRALEDPAIVIRRALQRRLPAASLPTEGGLVDLIHAAARALGRPLVLFLDQFEEFFIRLSPEFRAAFIAELGALYDALDVPVKVVLSLREDWLASVNDIRARIPEVFYMDMRLLPLTRDQACQAITLPVERLGARYEPALVERLLDDLGADVMPPQLQLVCSALYDGLPPGERLITLAAYEQLGGARGVLQKYLDDQLARLESGEQALARDVLQELVTSQRTKTVKTGGELAQALGVEADALKPVLEKLVRARLLRPVEREAGRAYELAHEYLIAEIAFGPEAVARKEAEELLRQGVENRRRFDALLSVEAFELIDAQCDRLRLDAEAQELMLRSALRHGRAVGRWLSRMGDMEQALGLAEQVLLQPQGEPARQALRTAASPVAPERLRVLAGRLTARWRKVRGVERACASDALDALRRYLPRSVQWQLALSRSSRAMRRVALPAAAVLATALVFVAVLWGPRLWTPKPNKIEWVDIPAGEFLMGSSDAEIEVARAMCKDCSFDDEKPQHKVNLDAFKIGKYEVTNAQYAQCVRSTVCKEPGDVSRYSDPGRADHPVVLVSWTDAKTFCEWIRGRLPTEAEWERAAAWDPQAGARRIYPWGNDSPTCERANFSGCSNDTMPVGRHSPAGDSPYGVADMAGNAWEWVADLYGGYSPEAQTNPIGPKTGNLGVLRGGGCNNNAIGVRAALRVSYNQGYRNFDVGFRCVGGALPGE
jgi:formylglycine-generating enzyme required for sulfatase activity